MGFCDILQRSPGRRCKASPNLRESREAYYIKLHLVVVNTNFTEENETQNEHTPISQPPATVTCTSPSLPLLLTLLHWWYGELRLNMRHIGRLISGQPTCLSLHHQLCAHLQCLAVSE